MQTSWVHGLIALPKVGPRHKSPPLDVDRESIWISNLAWQACRSLQSMVGLIGSVVFVRLIMVLIVKRVKDKQKHVMCCWWTYVGILFHLWSIKLVQKRIVLLHLYHVMLLLFTVCIGYKVKWTKRLLGETSGWRERANLLAAPTTTPSPFLCLSHRLTNDHPIPSYLSSPNQKVVITPPWSCKEVTSTPLILIINPPTPTQHLHRILPRTTPMWPLNRRSRSITSAQRWSYGENDPSPNVVVLAWPMPL